MRYHMEMERWAWVRVDTLTDGDEDECEGDKVLPVGSKLSREQNTAEHRVHDSWNTEKPPQNRSIYKWIIIIPKNCDINQVLIKGYMREEGYHLRERGGYAREEAYHLRERGGYAREEGYHLREWGGYARKRGGYARRQDYIYIYIYI